MFYLTNVLEKLYHFYVEGGEGLREQIGIPPSSMADFLLGFLHVCPKNDSRHISAVFESPFCFEAPLVHHKVCCMVAGHLVA